MDNMGNGGAQPANDRDTIPLPPEPSSPASPEIKPTAGPAPVSRAPLNLGGASAVPPASAPPRPAAPATPRPQAAGPRPAVLRPTPAGGTDRITGCKTFYTKLHPGAIDFLDEQINQWLKDNPGVAIKMTNTTTGEVQGKKTEANILMTVWYHGYATKTTSHMG